MKKSLLITFTQAEFLASFIDSAAEIQKKRLKSAAYSEDFNAAITFLTGEDLVDDRADAAMEMYFTELREIRAQIKEDFGI